MAARFASHPRIHHEVETTISYKSEEVSAYRYLAECYMESGFPGKAEYWYEQAVVQEPLLYDKEMVYQIKQARIDSLYKAGDYVTIIEELDMFLKRVDYIGDRIHWYTTQLYIRLGSAYRLSGQPDMAIAVWRRGMAVDETDQIYNDYYISRIAESLYMYDSTFTHDSLAAFSMETNPFFPGDDVTTSIIGIIVGISCNSALWFLIGGVIVLVTVITNNQQKSASQQTAIPKIPWGHIAVKFLIYVAVPVIIVPVVVTLVYKAPSLYVLSFIIASIGGATIGLLVAVFDAVHQAKKKQLPVRILLQAFFLPLWLVLVVVIAAGIAIMTLFSSFAFLTTFM